MSETKLGPYTVRVGLRPDNPAFPSYLIFKGDTFIGKQFSMPCEDDCRWLERQRGVYATESTQLDKSPYARRGGHATARKWSRPGRPTNAERALRDAAPIED